MGRDPITELSELMDACLAEVRSGRATLEQCLDRYPAESDKLRPLLHIALHLAPPPVTPDPERKAAARREFTAALHREPRAESSRLWSLPELMAFFALHGFGLPRRLALLAAVATDAGGTISLPAEIPANEAV